MERFKNNNKDTVDLLLQGKSIFAEMEIPEDSANFWRKMFQEPKGIADDPSYHLARLEFNPTEEYE